MNSMRYCAGFCLHSKKGKRYLTEKLLAIANEKGLEILPIDRKRDLEEQGPFHIIVHKCNADKDWEYQLAEYSVAHPEVLIVDPINEIRLLRDRSTMLSRLPKLRDGYVTTVGDARVYAPQQMEVSESMTIQQLETCLAENDMQFPLLLKPKWADGRDGSHMLAFIRDKEVQQVIPHNHVIFKVYVTGDSVHCMTRASLDTSKCLNAFQLLPRISSRNGARSIALAHYPPRDLIHSLALLLKNRLNLQLFNFDLIEESGRSDLVYYVVDINYFPGIDKIDNFELTFVDFIIGQCERYQQNITL